MANETDKSALTPLERANQSAHSMWADDLASKWLGFELGAMGEGTASLAFTVQQHHTNGHGICHGGIIFTLADSTFAFACNSRNKRTVAQHCNVSYVAQVRVGDRLTATATEVSLVGRNGIYDVKIVDQNQQTVGVFRGLSRTVRGQLFPEPQDSGEPK